MAQEHESAEPGFVIVRGSRSGEQLEISPGSHHLGRDDMCDMRIVDEGVSRRHAVVVRGADSVTIEDAGSTNGTFVNGSRITSVLSLNPGDEVSLGSAALRFRVGTGTRTTLSSNSPPSPGVVPRRRVKVGRVVLIGGLANLVILAAGVAIQFATDWTGIGPWLAAPLAGMVAALVEVGREALTREPETSMAGAADRTGDAASISTQPISPPRRRAPVLVGVLVAVLLVGVGGAVVAYGVATVSGYITGNQVGVPRLQNGPVAVDSGGVVTTIEAVDQTQDFTRVEITVQSNLANTISLPLFGFATLAAADGTTLDADPFRSSWSDSIGPGQLRRGAIIFDGHLPSGVTTASFAFATVFEQGFDGPTSILVPGLEIAALD